MDVYANDPEFVRIWERVKKPEAGPPSPVRDRVDLAPTLPPAGAFPLGEESVGEGSFLTRAIREELARHRSYARLASPEGGVAISLSRMALKRAKRLGAAWLLISGSRCRPQLPDPGQRLSWRDLFRQEQRAGAGYAAAKDRTADPLLRELYAQLREEAEEACRLIRRHLER